MLIMFFNENSIPFVISIGEFPFISQNIRPVFSIELWK